MEKWIIYLTDDDGNILCAKPFYGTTKDADAECDFLIEATGCEVSFRKYTESRWNRYKKYYKPQQGMLQCIEEEVS